MGTFMQTSNQVLREEQNNVQINHIIKIETNMSIMKQLFHYPTKPIQPVYSTTYVNTLEAPPEVADL